jgi:crotonobetainyl-CoA:carnitine CoA-transferase CaiB-like acyl-CoA transferase
MDAPPLAGITVVDLTRVGTAVPGRRERLLPARNMLEAIEHPTAGVIQLLGEHTRRVLEQDLQVPPAEIDALERKGVIGCR